MQTDTTIAVVGLGYVGLPLAVAFGSRRRTIGFDLNRGARVISIVPQPLSRDETGNLIQARDQIVIYFSEDDLDETSVMNRDAYQLIYTGETVSTLDDVTHVPTQVEYDSAHDQVVLTFAAPIDELSTGPGTYRLRIGTAETLQPAPQLLTTEFDPGSSFRSALDYYLQALELSRSLGLRPGEAIDLGNLALCYLELGDSSQALQVLDEALVLAKETG